MKESIQKLKKYSLAIWVALTLLVGWTSPSMAESFYSATRITTEVIYQPRIKKSPATCLYNTQQPFVTKDITYLERILFQSREAILVVKQSELVSTQPCTILLISHRKDLSSTEDIISSSFAA